MRPPTSSAVRFAVALVTAFTLPAVWADASHSVLVSATVLPQNTCHFTQPGPTLLPFGDIDPSSPAVATATAGTGLRCTGADPYVHYFVSSDAGLNPGGQGLPRMRHAVAPNRFLPYRVEFARSGTAPKNEIRMLSVTGRIEPSDFADAMAGHYVDSLILTIEP